MQGEALLTLKACTGFKRAPGANASAQVDSHIHLLAAGGDYGTGGGCTKEATGPEAFLCFSLTQSHRVFFYIVMWGRRQHITCLCLLFHLL